MRGGDGSSVMTTAAVGGSERETPAGGGSTQGRRTGSILAAPGRRQLGGRGGLGDGEDHGNGLVSGANGGSALPGSAEGGGDSAEDEENAYSEAVRIQQQRLSLGGLEHPPGTYGGSGAPIQSTNATPATSSHLSMR